MPYASQGLERQAQPGSSDACSRPTAQDREAKNRLWHPSKSLGGMPRGAPATGGRADVVGPELARRPLATAQVATLTALVAQA